MSLFIGTADRRLLCTNFCVSSRVVCENLRKSRILYNSRQYTGSIRSLYLQTKKMRRFSAGEQVVEQRLVLQRELHRPTPAVRRGIVFPRPSRLSHPSVWLFFSPLSAERNRPWNGHRARRNTRYIRGANVYSVRSSFAKSIDGICIFLIFLQFLSPIAMYSIPRNVYACDNSRAVSANLYRRRPHP